MHHRTRTALVLLALAVAGTGCGLVAPAHPPVPLRDPTPTPGPTVPVGPTIPGEETTSSTTTTVKVLPGGATVPATQPPSPTTTVAPREPSLNDLTPYLKTSSGSLCDQLNELTVEGAWVLSVASTPHTNLVGISPAQQAEGVAHAHTFADLMRQFIATAKGTEFEPPNSAELLRAVSEMEAALADTGPNADVRVTFQRFLDGFMPKVGEFVGKVRQACPNDAVDVWVPPSRP